MYVWLLAFVACGGSSVPTGPSAGSTPLGNSIAGTWRGALAGFAAAEHNGHLTVTLDELPYHRDTRPLMGTWRFAAADGRERTGTILGVSNGATAGIQLDAPPASTPCTPQVFPFYMYVGSFHLQVTIDGRRLHGTVQAYGCFDVTYGSVELTR